MSITIRPVRADDIPTLAEICFEAFGTLQDRHGVERDFDSVQTAGMVVGMFASRPDFAGFVAQDGSGRVLGSNFLQMSDAVAGVGPITIRPGEQSRGVGRELMEAVLDEARRRGIERVRLQQEAINTASLSLYTKLGFDWRAACSLMRLAPGAREDARMRPVTEADLGSIGEISERQYGHSRVNEVRGFLAIGLPGFVLRREGGGDVGYYFAGFLGHGFAQTPEDLADLVVFTARHSPPAIMKAIVPLGQHELHRRLLERGCRTLKLFNYMTVGPWEEPRGAWIPSVGM
ncbi:MAG: GNAT family N-acetyltransferase [Planctomycetota bacterium]